ncbi:MAG: ADP compounds hydrolase NudE, partial [Psychrosphaera sp.]|nr:ADP compounds hydrolase NudE [Psychrosphaera sp.]
MRHKKLPEIVASEVVAQSRLFTVEGLHLKFTNGVERQYERMKGSNRGAVMIIPMLDADTMLLISEYSAGTHSYELGFPKGLIDPGETPEQAANRELMEEVGYGANHMEVIKEMSLSPSYMEHTITVLYASDLYEKRLPGDEPEALEVVPYKLSELDQLVARADFTEARAIAALYM